MQKNTDVESPITMNNRIFIRWGSMYETEKILDSITYNTLEAVKKAINKKLTREILTNNRIPCPKLISIEDKEIKYPIIARPLKHARGQNLIVINNKKEFEEHYSNDWYYSEFIDKIQEFKIYVGHGKILGYVERFKGEDYINWNNVITHLDYTPVPANNWNIEVIKQSIKAVKALGLDFAGLDVLIDNKGKVFILEINTVPGISNYGTKNYFREYFDWLATSKEKLPHFEINSENPFDYSWVKSDKKVNFLIPNSYIHSALRHIFPKLKIGSKKLLNTSNIEEIQNLENKIFIRWRSEYETEQIKNSITYNTLEPVLVAQNKKLTRQVLFDAGVSIPRLVTPTSNKIKYPIIGRSKTHSFAQNFEVLPNKFSFESHYKKFNKEDWYYSEYIDKVKEYRINIGHGKILSITSKAPKNTLHWNGFDDEHISTIVSPNEIQLNIVQEALKAIKVIGLDFAGVDVIVDKENKPYILELNVSPGVSSSEYTQQKFIKYFEWLGNSDIKLPHFNIKNNNIKNYFW